MDILFITTNLKIQNIFSFFAFPQEPSKGFNLACISIWKGRFHQIKINDGALDGGTIHKISTQFKKVDND